jgi:superfamily I DNA and/or RNA helicase
VPFQQMIATYKSILAKLQFVSLLDIKVGLPTEFQGIEKDIIIVSHLRNSQQHHLGYFSGSGPSQHHNANFANIRDSNESTKIFNLAFTRAKRFLWFVGNLSQVAAQSTKFSNLLKQVVTLHKKGFRAYEAFESYEQWRNAQHF